MNIDPIRIVSKVRNNRMMELRESMGMSVRQFADYVGVCYNTMNKIENLSMFPGLKVIDKLREKLGSVVDEMFPEYLKNIAKTVSVRTIPEEEVLQLSSVNRRELISSQAESGVLTDEIKELLESALGQLNPRQREVVSLRFGLVDQQEWTLKEIGQKLGVSAERVRGIESEALRRLRHPRRSRAILRLLNRR